MFSRTQRIPRDAFGAVLKGGSRKNTQHLVLRTLRRADSGPPRLGIVVSKKTAKKATARNTIKRLLRAILRSRYENIPAGFDMLILSRGNLDDVSYDEMVVEVDQLLR